MVARPATKMPEVEEVGLVQLVVMVEQTPAAMAAMGRPLRFLDHPRPIVVVVAGADMSPKVRVEQVVEETEPQEVPIRAVAVDVQKVL